MAGGLGHPERARHSLGGVDGILGSPQDCEVEVCVHQEAPEKTVTMKKAMAQVLGLTTLILLLLIRGHAE